MLPRDDDRRTYVCCAIIVLVPVLLAAASVTVSIVIERWELVAWARSAAYPLTIFNGVAAGAVAAWAAVMLPGGTLRLTIVAAVAAFLVGPAIYAVAFLPFAIVAEIVV